MKKSIFLILGVITAYVNPMSAEPSACPSVEAIKRVGITDAGMGNFFGEYWAGLSSDKFDTNEIWEVSVITIGANSREDAIKMGNEILQQPLVFAEGPKQEEEDDKSIEWTCYYTTDDNIVFAVTR